MSAESVRTARLDALGAVRAILADRTDDVDVLVQHTEDPREAFHAAVSLAASLLTLMPAQTRTNVLNGLTEAAVQE